MQELFLKLAANPAFAAAKNPPADLRQAALHLALDWRRARLRSHTVAMLPDPPDPAPLRRRHPRRSRTMVPHPRRRRFPAHPHPRSLHPPLRPATSLRRNRRHPRQNPAPDPRPLPQSHHHRPHPTRRPQQGGLPCPRMMIAPSSPNSAASHATIHPQTQPTAPSPAPAPPFSTLNKPTLNGDSSCHRHPLQHRRRPPRRRPPHRFSSIPTPSLRRRTTRRRRSSHQGL